jgi:integrase
MISLILLDCRDTTFVRVRAFAPASFPYNFRMELFVARTIRNQKLDTRSARLRLPERREPYWHVISKGCAIGYRRGVKGGGWIARMRSDDGKQHYESLGAADDIRDADGLTCFTFAQAQERARAFFDQKGRQLAGHAEESGPYKVDTAIEDYLNARERRGSKGVKADRYAARARIIPAFGEIETSKLTAKRIRDWHEATAEAPKLVRTGKFATKQATRAFDANDAEEVRARRSTANRLLTILKAALNHAFHEGRVTSDETWRKVKPFREADSAVIRYLSAGECKRLINACPPDFRAMVRGALATGCRYGELTRMRVSDFNFDAATVTLRITKGGNFRHVALADEGRAIFESLTRGRRAQELVFLRLDGEAWGASHQQRPLTAASVIAQIDPPATFHMLRHTYGSALAMKGVPMGVIAAQLGHSDTRMTERHYAHLSPNYIADTVRASLPALGDFAAGNVVSLDRRIS